MIYRQEIIKDLMANEGLCDALKKEISAIKLLIYFNNGAKRMHDRNNSLDSLLEELRELKVYVSAVGNIHNALSENDIRSEALLSLRDSLRAIVEDEEFKSVKPDIEKIHDDLSSAKGAVIGVSHHSDKPLGEVMSSVSPLNNTRVASDSASIRHCALQVTDKAKKGIRKKK